MGRLRVRAYSQGGLEELGGTWATDFGGAVSLGQVAVSLEVTFAIADVNEGAVVLEGDFKEYLLARGPTIVMECKHEWKLRMQALEEALDKAAQESCHENTCKS